MGFLEFGMVNRAKYNYRGSGFDVLTWFRIQALEYGLRCDGVVTRAKLALVDFGLYRTLLRSGKLEEAIPEKNSDNSRNNLKPDAVEKIIRAYTSSGENAAQAARDLKHCKYTVLSTWRVAGLEIRRKGGISLTNKEILRIMKLSPIFRLGYN